MPDLAVLAILGAPLPVGHRSGQPHIWLDEWVDRGVQNGVSKVRHFSRVADPIPGLPKPKVTNGPVVVRWPQAWPDLSGYLRIPVSTPENPVGSGQGIA